MPLTEEQIERRVELATNRLDRSLMQSHIDQAAYDSEMKRLSKWAESQLKKVAK
jgi:hypothetical protein